MKSTKGNEIKAIILLAIAVVIFISIATFDYNDIKFFTSSPNVTKANFTGSAGAFSAGILLFTLGLASYLIPFFIALLAVMPFLEEHPRKFYLRITGAAFLMLASSSILSLMGSQNIVLRYNRGGMIGLAFSDFLLKYLGVAGAIIVVIALLLLSFIIAMDILLFPFVGWIVKSYKSMLGKAKDIVPLIKSKIVDRKTTERKATVIESVTPSKQQKDISKPPEQVKIKSEPGKPEPSRVREEVKPKIKKRPAVTKPYNLPSLELLQSPPPAEEREIKEDLKENSTILEETLSDFGIKAKVVEVNKGPVITRYELEPASGVKIHRITSLSDNIALAMKAVSIRVVAPIPGKKAIGVEIPNSKSMFVYLKEVLESKEYEKLSSKLKLVLGKGISGVPIVTDLGDMPHLLIAGATGSGKTVCVNSIITTLLFNSSPDELKFLMVDPKRVELATFNNLPHLLTPVVTEPKKVSHALSWVVDEMEKRYELFAELGVRNIDGYNERAKKEDLEILPYIIVVIDELADLMLVSQQEIENMITRLAQLSRAVGIHMIIATQRPSVDVITGVIKANFPARISFKVASKVDSRTVIDMNGAEKLLGKGDMLFIEPGNPKPLRAQGCLVSDKEIERVASFIKTQREAEFQEEILKAKDKPKYKTFERDEIYEEAVRLVLQTRQASVSMLQRRLGVGYTRAARLIDMMEDERIVGPYQGSKPREILIEKEENLKKK